MSLGYSIVIPTLNEEKNIQLLIDQICKNLEENLIKYEIIFVDDLSSDRTVEIINKNKQINKKIRVLIRKQNFDLSLSVVDGVKISNFNNIIVMDADLQHPPSTLKKMISCKKKCHLVIASRYKRKKFKFNSQNRNFQTQVGIFLSNLFIGKKVSDPLSGFFIVDKDLIIDQLKYFTNRGYKILLNILLVYDNLLINEIDFDFEERRYGNTKLNFKVKLYFIILLVKSIFFKRFNVNKKTQ